MSIVPVKALEWGPELSFGIAEMDELHKLWLDIINRLHEAMLCGKGEGFLRAECAKAISLLLSRLELEDKLIAAVHYPDKRHHAQGDGSDEMLFGHGDFVLHPEFARVVHSSLKQVDVESRE
jgi:hypothetical protein